MKVVSRCMGGAGPRTPHGLLLPFVKGEQKHFSTATKSLDEAETERETNYARVLLTQAATQT